MWNATPCACLPLAATLTLLAAAALWISGCEFTDDFGADGSGRPVALSDPCDPVTTPCPRTTVCEHGVCRPAARCLGLAPGDAGDAGNPNVECPVTDADGDPLFCEYTYCVEACEVGGLHCPAPDLRCDVVSKTCVSGGGLCRGNEECASGRICWVLEGDVAGYCIVGDSCFRDSDCEASIDGALCHPTQRRCLSCVHDEHCRSPRERCNLETFSCEPPRPRECLADVECCPPHTDCALTCDLGDDPASCVEAQDRACMADHDCLTHQGRYCQRPCRPSLLAPKGGTAEPDPDELGAGRCAPPCDQPGAPPCPPPSSCGPDGRCSRCAGVLP